MSLADELSNYFSEGFERELYQAALQNLEDENNKLRLNNFAYAMRELVRQVLTRLAPDSSVRECCWYKNETEKADGVSRRQRASFAVQGGLSDDYIKNSLGIDANGIHAALIQAIKNLSKYTHIEPSTFALPSVEVESSAAEALQAVGDLFATIESCRAKIIERLWEQVDENVIFEALRETIGAIDEIAPHHFIDEIYTDKVVITAIDQNNVFFTATGTVSCELQWGSNSDIRQGNGAVIPKTFPFSCSLVSPVDDLSEIECDEDGFLVDTSEWWEGYYDESL